MQFSERTKKAVEVPAFATDAFDNRIQVFVFKAIFFGEPSVEILQVVRRLTQKIFAIRVVLKGISLYTSPNRQ